MTINVVSDFTIWKYSLIRWMHACLVLLWHNNLFITLQAAYRVSYPNRVISRVKCIGYIGKGVLNSHLGSSPYPCYIQNGVITHLVVKIFFLMPFRIISFISSQVTPGLGTGGKRIGFRGETIWSSPITWARPEHTINLGLPPFISAMLIGNCHIHYYASLCITEFSSSFAHMIFFFYMSLITRKPVFGVSDQVTLKLACSASEAR